MTTPVLTRARWRGLRSLRRGGWVPISNRTVDGRFVYWQTARWLVEEGLAEQHVSEPLIRLTDRGAALLPAEEAATTS